MPTPFSFVEPMMNPGCGGRTPRRRFLIVDPHILSTKNQPINRREALLYPTPTSPFAPTPLLHGEFFSTFYFFLDK